MIKLTKTSIGELTLSPIKENGKFVFVNDFVTINGKVAKGDWVKIYIDAYRQVSGKWEIVEGRPSAILLVKGKEYQHNDPNFHKTIEEYYAHLTEVYKNHYYFGKKE